MCEAEIDRILRQRFGEFIPGRKRTVGAFAPRRGMDFVNRNWCIAGIRACTIGGNNYFLRRCGNDACRAGAKLGCAGVWIRLERQQLSIRSKDFEFVTIAHRRVRDEYFPDAGATARTHRMPPPIPSIEVADHTDAPRIWRPQCKTHAVDCIRSISDGEWMRTKYFVWPQVCAFAKKP